MKKVFVMVGCFLTLLSLCACNQEPEVSLVDPAVTSSAYIQNHSGATPEISEELSQSEIESKPESDTESSEESFPVPEISYDDKNYPEDALTPQRINETLKKAGYKDLEFKETSPGTWSAKSGNLELTFNTQLYIVQGFLYNVKVKDWSEKSITEGVEELCKYTNAVYPDAIDDAKKKEIIQVCKKAAESDDPALYDITYQYKDQPTTWFNFGINFENKTIGAYNPRFP